MKIKSIWLGCLFFLLLLAHLQIHVSAEDITRNEEMLQIEDAEQTEDIRQIEESLVEEFDFDSLDDGVAKLLPESKLTFKNLFRNVMKGDFESVKELFLKTVSDQFFYELHYHKQTFVRMIFIALVAALLSNFSNAFQNRQVTDVCFYILYLLLLTLCLSSFRIAMDEVDAQLQTINEFMQILCPTYFLSVAIAVGGNTSIVFYHIVLFTIYLVELVIISLVMPAIHIYIMIQMMDHLSTEEVFTQLTELIEKMIIWSLKGMTALIIGVDMIQRLLSPAMDSLSRSIITKSAEAVPAIGDALSGSTEILLGTAVLIKNSIGITGVIVCLLIMVIPMFKMGCMVLLFKLASAIVQPISDKRITGCITSVSKGGELLLRVLYTVTLLFLLTIAIVATTTHIS